MKRRKNSIKLTTPRVAARSVSAAAGRDTNPYAALIRSAACVVVNVIRQRAVPTLSFLLRARSKHRKDKSDAAISGEEKGALVCDMSGEYNDESNDEGGYSAFA